MVARNSLRPAAINRIAGSKSGLHHASTEACNGQRQYGSACAQAAFKAKGRT